MRFDHLTRMAVPLAKAGGTLQQPQGWSSSLAEHPNGVVGNLCLSSMMRAHLFSIRSAHVFRCTLRKRHPRSRTRTMMNRTFKVHEIVEALLMPQCFSVF